jgi:transcription antitermination factor NusG
LAGEAATVRENEIELMKQHLNGLYQSVSLTKFTRGQLYKISEGVFSGRIGKVVETQKIKLS